MRYSVIMPVLLREQQHRVVVESCLKSIEANSKDYELIIIDDGSSLMTGFLRDEATTYIRHKENMGIAPSWNDGIKLARGEYLAIVNDDIVVHEDWLEGLRRPFLELENVGVTAPAVLHIPHSEGIVEDFTWFPGFCFMFNRNTMKKVAELDKERNWGMLGVFDERFVPYNGEDVDFWERNLMSGLKLFRNYNVIINHREGDVIHALGNYEKRSKEANEQFTKKHGFDPVAKYYPPVVK